MERIILTDSIDQTATIFGSFDSNIAVIERAYGVNIINRDTEKTAGDAIIISGSDSEAVNAAATAVEYLKKMAALNDTLTEQNVEYVINMLRDGREDELHEFDEGCICITVRGRPIKAKTVGQRKYVEAIKNNTIVLGIGSAGTGKTFLAVAMAVSTLRNK